MHVLAALAVISWTAPTHNTDGSVLTNLESHVVYCATTFAAIESSPRGEVMMPDQSFVLPALAAGGGGGGRRRYGVWHGDGIENRQERPLARSQGRDRAARGSLHR